MNDKTLAFWLASMLIIELIAVGTVFLMALHGERYKLPTFIKVALLVMCFGLLVQVIRTTHFFEFGKYPTDRYFPLWITKDIAASMLIFWYAIKGYK